MKVLVIGSGGREHAIVDALTRSPQVEKIYCAPGNGGTAQEGENIPLKDSDVAGLVSFAKGNVIDFVIPGPELPLTLGVVDAMTQAGIRCFGPSQWCAQLEGSKAFAKDIMQKAGVPTAACGVFTELEAAKSFVEEKGAPIVIKADGLAAGKGVVVAQTKEEALEALDQIMGGVFGAAGSRVVIEEFLVGEEVSLLAFCDGKTALPLPSAQDHKAVFDGDTGPNTGGMGAYSPAPIVPDAELEKMADIAIRHDLIVVSDEIYEKLVYGGAKHISIASLPGMKERSIVLNGFSKSMAMTGWRLGYIAAPENMIEPMNRLSFYMTAGATTFVQYAGVAGLLEEDGSIERMRQEFKRRRDYLVEEINKMQHFSCKKPEGAFYIFMNIKKSGMTADEFCAYAIDKYRLATIPGTAFGRNGEGYVRLSYASSMEVLQKAISILHQIDQEL